MDALPYTILINTISIFFIGIALGFFLDIISFIEIYIQNLVDNKLIPWTVYFTKDLTSTLVFTVTFILTLYYFNGGKFRGMLLIAIIAGLFFYKKTIGTLFKRFLNTLAKLIQKILIFLLQPIAKICIKLYNKYVKKCKSRVQCIRGG